MKLVDDFYTIERVNEAEDGFEYLLALNKAHFIYRAHFPGNPITPGVCMIQMCKELMEHHTGKKLILVKVVNIKYLAVINPTLQDTIHLNFSKVTSTDETHKCSVLIHAEGIRFAKLSLIFTQP